MLKDVIIFASGIALGAGVTYVYVTKREQNRNEKDIAELKAYYNNQYKEEFREKMSKYVGKEDSETVMINQNGNEKPVEDKKEPINEPIWEKEVEKIVEKVKNDDKRVIISSEEFLEDEDFDKVTLYYYEDDETFCDPEYVIIPEAIDWIGKENLNNVGMFEDGVLYVRNSLYGKDYEVIFFDESYADSVGVEGE